MENFSGNLCKVEREIVLIRLKNYLNLFGDHIGDLRTIGNISPFRIEPDLGVNDVWFPKLFSQAYASPHRRYFIIWSGDGRRH